MEVQHISDDKVCIQNGNVLVSPDMERLLFVFVIVKKDWLYNVEFQ